MLDSGQWLLYARQGSFLLIIFQYVKVNAIESLIRNWGVICISALYSTCFPISGNKGILGMGYWVTHTIKA